MEKNYNTMPALTVAPDVQLIAPVILNISMHVEHMIFPCSSTCHLYPIQKMYGFCNRSIHIIITLQSACIHNDLSCFHT